MPIGIFIILLACFGVSSLIGLSSVSFPASVAVLVLLFFGLTLSEFVVGERKTKALVKIIDIPVSLLHSDEEEIKLSGARVASHSDI